MNKLRAEEEEQAAKQADLERRSTLLAEKLRNEERQIQEQLFLQSVCSLCKCAYKNHVCMSWHLTSFEPTKVLHILS